MKAIWRMAGRTSATIMAALLLTALGGAGCGGELVDNRPENTGNGASLTLAASTATQTHTTKPVLRANGRDALLAEATVSGSSALVGFFFPSTYGTISASTAAQVDLDGYVYFEADRDGVARATVIAGLNAGSTELLAKSKNLTASLPVTMQLGVMSLTPATMNLSSHGARGTITASGGMPPISWSATDPAAIRLTPTSDTTVRAVVGDLGALIASGGVTVTAVDAEGQTATMTISSTATCQNATVTVSPATGATGATTATVSVIVTDEDRAGWTSIPMKVHYPNGLASADITLTPWVTPGAFQTNYTVNCVGCIAADIVRFEYSDLAADCLTPTLVAATFTLK